VVDDRTDTLRPRSDYRLETRYPKFFVVSGVDGAGKTTMLARVAAQRPEWQVGSYQPQDWLPQEQAAHFEWALSRHPKTVVHRLAPLSRAGFFLSMMSCHWDYWIQPRLEAGRVVVMDSYYYRFYAKEKVRGQAPDFFFRGLESLPSAATLILADLPLETAADRKQRFDPYEVAEVADREDFLAFQSRVLVELQAVCRRSETPLLRLDAARPQEEVGKRLVELIDRQLSGT